MKKSLPLVSRGKDFSQAPRRDTAHTVHRNLLSSSPEQEIKSRREVETLCVETFPIETPAFIGEVAFKDLPNNFTRFLQICKCR